MLKPSSEPRCYCTECQHRREQMRAVLNECLLDLLGQPLSQALVTEAHRRVQARLAIMPQLLERAL